MSENPVPPRVPPRSPVPPRPAGTPAPVAKNPAAARVPIPPRTASPSPVPAKVPAQPVPSTAATSSAQTPKLVKKTATGEPVVAKAATYYRMTRYTMVAVLIGMAGWFAYDGFKGWPTENAKIEAARAAAADAAKNAKSTDQPVEKDPMALKQPHSEFDIAIQKLLAFGLPLAAIAMLAWALRNSRGEYRLAGQTLSVPGHPPVEFSDIVEVDKALWDRKGIAYIVYKTSAGTGRLRLDDFIYERDPTDEIYNQIEAYMDSAIQTPAAD